MGIKTISISDEVHDLLESHGKEGESFSDLILRLLAQPNQEDLLNLAGS